MNDICYNNYCKKSGATVSVIYPCVYRLQNNNNLLKLAWFYFYTDLTFQKLSCWPTREFYNNIQVLFRSQH